MYSVFTKVMQVEKKLVELLKKQLRVLLELTGNLYLEKKVLNLLVQKRVFMFPIRGPH